MQREAGAGIHRYSLAAGATALIKQKNNIPLVTMAIGARGGVHNETPEQAGYTGLMARASVKGTANHTAAEIAQIAEAMGGNVGPSVGADTFDWEITVPARHFERALELLADVAFHASFPAAEFEIERKLAIADIQQSRDDMYRYPLRLVLQQAFRQHPYGNTISAVEQSLTAATRDQIAAWHRRQIRVAPWFFVVGDVDPDAAARAIEQYAPRQSEPDGAPIPFEKWSGASSDVESRDKAQTALALAFPGPASAHPDTYALQVLANAVGGLGGRFFEELRSKRSLAYTVALMPVVRWQAGAFIAYIATAPEREAEARSALLEQFERLKNEPLAAEEVERAQRYAIGTWQIRSQTNSAQLADLMSAYLVGEGIAEILDFEDRVRAVTPAAIQAAAQRYFTMDQMVEGIVRGKGAA